MEVHQAVKGGCPLASKLERLLLSLRRHWWKAKGPARMKRIEVEGHELVFVPISRTAGAFEVLRSGEGAKRRRRRTVFFRLQGHGDVLPVRDAVFSHLTA